MIGRRLNLRLAELKMKSPLSRRASEDKGQTDLLLRAWEESGKVYGYPSADRQLFHNRRKAQAVRRPSRSGRDVLPEPDRASDPSRGDQGRDRLQAPSRHLWRQACRRYRQQARPASRRGGSRQGVGHGHHLHPNLRGLER